MEAFAHRKRDVDLIGIEGHTTWHERNFIESIGAARSPAYPNLKIPTNAEASP